MSASRCGALSEVLQHRDEVAWCHIYTPDIARGRAYRRFQMCTCQLSFRRSQRNGRSLSRGFSRAFEPDSPKSAKGLRALGEIRCSPSGHGCETGKGADGWPGDRRRRCLPGVAPVWTNAPCSQPRRRAIARVYSVPGSPHSPLQGECHNRLGQRHVQTPILAMCRRGTTRLWMGQQVPRALIAQECQGARILRRELARDHSPIALPPRGPGFCPAAAADLRSLSATQILITD